MRSYAVRGKILARVRSSSPIIHTWKPTSRTYLIFIPSERARRLAPASRVRRDVDRDVTRGPQARDRREDKDPCSNSHMIRLAVRARLISDVRRSETPARAAAPRSVIQSSDVRFQAARSDRKRARTSRLFPLVNVDQL